MPTLAQTANWGAFAAPEPFPDCSAHYALEHALGQSLPTMSWFVTFAQDFPSAAADAKARKYKLLIALMPIIDGVPVQFSAVLDGSWDAYLIRFFTAAKSYGHAVNVRFAHEMNLGKHPWSVGQGGPSSVSEFIATWKYVYRLQKRVCGADSNVQLIWCISTAEGAIPTEQYFPGIEYIDKTGFDAFSGSTPAGWTEPRALLEPTTTRLKRLAPGRPIWVCELGCREPSPGESRSKAQWITDLFDLTGLAALTHIIWFSKLKEEDWRLTSSPAVQSAASRGLAQREPARV